MLPGLFPQSRAEAETTVVGGGGEWVEGDVID